jgi:hypothetical protein
VTDDTIALRWFAMNGVPLPSGFGAARIVGHGYEVLGPPSQTAQTVGTVKPLDVRHKSSAMGPNGENSPALRAEEIFIAD